MFAARNGHVEVVEKLARAHVDVDASNDVSVVCTFL